MRKNATLPSRHHHHRLFRVFMNHQIQERERKRDFGEEGYEKSKENTKTGIANGFLLFFVSLPIRTNNLAFYY